MKNINKNLNFKTFLLVGFLSLPVFSLALAGQSITWKMPQLKVAIETHDFKLDNIQPSLVCFFEVSDPLYKGEKPLALKSNREGDTKDIRKDQFEATWTIGLSKDQDVIPKKNTLETSNSKATALKYCALRLTFEGTSTDADKTAVKGQFFIAFGDSAKEKDMVSETYTKLTRLDLDQVKDDDDKDGARMNKIQDYLKTLYFELAPGESKIVAKVRGQ